MKHPITATIVALLVVLTKVSFAEEGKDIERKFSKTPGVVKMEKIGRIESLFKVTKCVCFTRFIMDVPADATVVYGRMTVDAEIERYVERAFEAEKIIELQMSENREGYRLFGRSGEIDKLAEAPISTNDDRVKHVVGITGFNKYSLDTFVVLGRDVYVLNSKGILRREIYKFMRDNEVVASMLLIRLENEIPEEEGVCIDGAFTPQNPDFENIELGVRLAEFPDVHLSISIIKHSDYAEPQEEFLIRHNEALNRSRASGLGEWVDRLRFLRKAQRRINGWNGYEILTQFPAWESAKEGHQFAFWSTGAPNDPLHPQVDIKLDTGIKGNSTRGVPSSLTDDEAIALWDRLLNSIRIRPVKAGKKKSSYLPTVPEIPTGTQQCTDSTCLASGWWQSFDSGAVEPVRWIAKGDRMPPIHFRQEQTWRDKLFDTQRVVLGGGMWQLMRHDERDVPPRF